MKREYWTWGCACGDYAREKYFRSQKTASKALQAHEKKCTGIPEETPFTSHVWRLHSIDRTCKHCGQTREIEV